MTSPPPISEAMRSQARQLAGKWLYVLDPLVDPAGRVPGEAVRGAWPVSPQGEIVEEGWQPNPRYRPREPSEEEVVSALLRLKTGAATVHDFRLIGHAQVTVVHGGAGGMVTVYEGRPGPAVEAWLRDEQARAAHPTASAWRRIRLVDLAEELSAQQGLEFVLPTGNRVGIVAEGVRHLVGSSDD